MDEFHYLVEKYVRQPYPELYQLLIMKIDGMLGEKIAAALSTPSQRYSAAAISKLWRQKLPKVIAEGAQ